MKIALISCSKSKQNYSCKACEMYLPSTLFKYSYEYAKKTTDKVYILSAKYGLISEYALIEPYDLTLKTMNTREKIAWSNKVISQLKSEFDLDNDEFIVLAGKDYNEYLLKSFKSYELPLGNRPQGMRVSFLIKALQEGNYENDCMTLHELFGTAKRFTYDEINRIPFNNGIYIVFEKGERYNNLERIVRVGTHDSPDRLKTRLKDHFFNENKDGSIFRKNIGKAILNKRHDDYLDTWSLDTSKNENRIFVNIQKQKAVEKEVSDYLRNNFTYTCFEVENKEKRLRLEKAIIATLNLQEDFCPSKEWLGRFSPVERIRESGLWLTIGLDAQKLTSDESRFIKSSVLGNLTRESPVNIVPKKIKPEVASESVFKKYIGASTGEIEQHIRQLINEAKEKGAKELVLVSGNIHRDMGLKSRLPSVCSAMYQVMKAGDEILFRTPSGKSSTIKIRYNI